METFFLDFLLLEFAVFFQLCAAAVQRREAGLNLLRSSLCPGFAVNSAVCGSPTLAVGEAFKRWGSEGCKDKNTNEIKEISSEGKPAMTAASCDPEHAG